MAILNSRPQQAPAKTPIKKTDTAQITEPVYVGATVDTRYQDRRSLITHVGGSSWEVRYFQQVLGGNNELTPQQLSKDAVYQQYIQVDELELKVTSALTPSQDEETKSFEVTGVALVYPSLIPNKGDMFLADIGDGREGLFTVTNSTRMSILNETCYEIEYILVSEATEERRSDLAKKVIKKTHFVKELLDHGQKPVIVDEDYADYLSLGQWQERLLGSYLASFVNKRIGTLAVPGQEFITYDPFLVKALKSITDTDDHALARSLKSYSTQLPDREVPQTFWDAFLKLSMDMLPLCHEKLALVDACYFGRLAQFESVFFSNVQDVVYPIDRHNSDICSSQLQAARHDPRDIRHQFVTTRLGGLMQLMKPQGTTGFEALYPVHPVTKDDYYVFTEAFYFHQYEQQSQLETLVRYAMTGKPIDRRVLVNLCELSTRWAQLERFYYTPILLILLKLTRLGH